MSLAVARKWGALTVFVAQNAGVVLIMRYSRIMPGAPYSSRVAVLAQECTKLPICSLFFAIESGGILAGVRALKDDLANNSIEWLQLGVPAFLYTLQNNALFIGLTNLEAAIAHVTYQTKILFTALFSICMLGKQLGRTQWLGLLMLVLGVVCVQGLLDQLLATRSVPPTSSPALPSRNGRRHKPASRMLEEEISEDFFPEDQWARMLAEAAGGSALVGMMAMLTASVCTSFASVYFEKMLKGSRKPSLWLRNIQLATYSGSIAYVTVLFEDDPLRATEGWLHGFTAITWGVVGMNVLGGLLVAVTIKYADNIVRGFAQAVAIIFGAIGSYFLFDFHFTASFMFGVLFVIAAILLYGGAIDPSELCSRLAQSVFPSRAKEGDDEVALIMERDGVPTPPLACSASLAIAQQQKKGEP
uniref:UDP-galactose transporter n=1 Tax=Calcidiscus leptoporus TaxID=127549 RepID=A0A7S0IZD6_9EUKA|mmetsp:Transcript_31321/g.72886  ORF Transcript_31321/g.72886 Transcript_31321/m.72886 type:complete len:416 (+) Transcript_31321:124-1371(+)